MSTSPILDAAAGRRLFIGGSFATLALAAVPSFVRAFTPQVTNAVAANHFMPDPATVASLDRFSSGVRAAHSALTAYQESHRNLFLRTAELRWMETSSGADVKPGQHSEKLSIWCDKFLPFEHQGMEALAANLAHLERFAGGTGSRLKGSSLLDIRSTRSEAELRSMGDDEFAQAFGFNWDSEGKGVAGPVALAATMSIPLSALALFYRPLWDRMTDASTESEASMSRRAFFRFATSGAAAAVGLTTMGDAKESVERIREEGRGRIRRVMLDGSRMSDIELFRRFLGGSPLELSQKLLLDLRAFRDELSQMNLAEVSRALAGGLIDLRQQAETRITQIMHERRGAFGFEFVEADDIVDLLNMFSQYMELANRTARTFAEYFPDVSDFLQEGQVAMLGPAMRALYITDGVGQTTVGERGGHLGRIAGDAGLYVGIPLGALLLSEIPGPHHAASHRMVQFVGRLWNGVFRHEG